MTPDKVTARKMVLIGVVGLAVISVYRDHHGQSSAGTFRVMWGVGVVGMFLSLLADFAPTLAGPFALLVLLGSLTSGGDQALQKILGAIVPASPSAPASSSSARSGSAPAPAASRPATVPAGG